MHLPTAVLQTTWGGGNNLIYRIFLRTTKNRKPKKDGWLLASKGKRKSACSVNVKLKKNKKIK